MRSSSAVTMPEDYLSNLSIDVSGKMRLWTRQKISTLTLPEHDSGDSWKDINNEGEEEGREEDCEEVSEEEEEVSEGCIQEVRPYDAFVACG
jgi:hypothetical protein